MIGDHSLPKIGLSKSRPASPSTGGPACFTKRKSGGLFLNHDLHVFAVLVLRRRVDRKEREPAAQRAVDHEEHEEHDDHGERGKQDLAAWAGTG